MVKRVKEMLAAGIEVRIFTARASSSDPVVIGTIQDWCEKHVGSRLIVTNVKDYDMIHIYDDRAIQIIPNTGHRADGKE